MKPSTKIFLANTVVFLLYTVLMSLQKRPDMGLWAVLILFHLFADFVLAIVAFILKRKDAGLAFLLGFCVVLLVGFGTCASLARLDLR